MTKAACLAVLWGCTAPAEARIRPGGEAPALGTEAGPDEAVVVWASRPADYMSCQSPAFALRRIQRRFGDRVKVVAVSVDEAEKSDLAADFFRNERVDATVMRVGEREWRRLAGDTRLPSLYVSRNGRIVRIWSSPASVRAAGTGSPPPLTAAVDSVFGRADGATRTASAERADPALGSVPPGRMNGSGSPRHPAPAAGHGVRPG